MFFDIQKTSQVGGNLEPSMKEQEDRLSSSYYYPELLLGDWRFTVKKQQRPDDKPINQKLRDCSKEGEHFGFHLLV